MKPDPRPERLSGLKHFLGSLRFRLLLWGEAILLLVLVVFSAMVYYRQVGYQETALMQSAGSEASSILDTYSQYFSDTGGRDGLRLSTVFPELQVDDQQKPVIVGKAAASEKFPLQDGEFLVVVGPDNQVIDWSGDLSEEQAADLGMMDLNKRTEGPLYSMYTLEQPDTGQQAGEYLVVQAITLLSDTQKMAVVLGTPFDPYGQIAGLGLSLVLASLIILGLSLVGGYWLTGRLMQPVQAITSTAQEINANDLTRRLNLGRRDELGELADTFDRMLERLEAAFERQHQFTADASHELRTPLTIINVVVNSLLEDPLTRSELGKPLGVIRDENERITHLVEDLLVLARADAGKALLKPETVDFSELTLDVVERFIPLSQRNEVTITTGEMPPVMVRGDRFYLSQMVANLVENAIKYGAGEERKVWVETGCREEGSAHWGWVRVEDHGPGIAEDQLPHLFDRFYRVDPARQEDVNDEAGAPLPANGHGLGLSIVQWVAQAHGGEVRVTSQVGKGAVFEVVLPVLDGVSGGMATV